MVKNRPNSAPPMIDLRRLQARLKWPVLYDIRARRKRLTEAAGRSRARSERLPHASKRRLPIREHELCGNAHHPVPRFDEPAIAPRVGALPSELSVVTAINF